MDRNPSNAQNSSGSMHQGNLGSYSSSSTGGTAGRGSSPSGIGITGGTSQTRYGAPSGNSFPTDQETEQVVRGVTGMISSVSNAASNLFSPRRKDKEREKQMLAAEKMRHDEEMRKLDEEIERTRQSRTQVNAIRHENYNKANEDLQRRQMEREKREQELSKRKDQERKNNEEALQRERELYDQRIRAAEERNQQLMADTKTSMEADHQNFLSTKAHMENTHQMESNMIKGLAGATAYLYKEMGYFNDPPEHNGNQGVRLRELEAAPTSHQMNNTQPVEAINEQRPMETSSSQQVPDCFKCGSTTRMTFCSHFFCPNCHVNEGKVHCPVCQKIF